MKLSIINTSTSSSLLGSRPPLSPLSPNFEQAYIVDNNNLKHRKAMFNYQAFNLDKKKMVGDYYLSDTIGEGSYGKVKLVYSTGGEKYAAKILSKENISDLTDLDRVYKETYILTTLRHNNIIKLYEVINTNNSIVLIMEYADSGHLMDYLVKNVRITELDANKLFYQILAGIEYCHRKQIVHRDLKLENIILTSDGTIKIADFGLSNSIQFGQKMDTACGTPFYIAPEIIKNKEYSAASTDIWSLGVIMYTLICGYLPFEADHGKLLLKKISLGNPKYPSYISSHCKDFLRSMMTVDPEMRADINSLRANKWFLMDFNGVAEELDNFPLVSKEEVQAARAANIKATDLAIAEPKAVIKKSFKSPLIINKAATPSSPELKNLFSPSKLPKTLFSPTKATLSKVKEPIKK